MNVSATASASSYAYGSYAANGAGRGNPSESDRRGTDAAADTNTGTKQLSSEEQAQIRKLQARDREVRQHEQAHLSAAGGLAVSGPSFTYQQGPDGRNYAIGGEVGISVSPGQTPEETIRKASQIQASALAPASPSGQDRAVAAQAATMAQQARAQQAQESSDEGRQSTDKTGAGQDRRADIQAAYGNPQPSGQLFQAYA